jgi:NAD(P)-dependent dehydrogenase (short-subunit alcohol dehydrogenase family)
MAVKKPVALVTGGSRGIGRGISLELGKNGYLVVVNYEKNLDAAQATHNEIEQAGGEADILQGNVGEPAHRDLMVNFILDTYGRIDLLVNNAGIAPRVRADILETGEESFDHLMDVNLKGPFFLTQRVASAMVDLISNKVLDRGAIVNISSMSAYTASVNRAEYCISKAGMSMMTQLFAARLAEHGINVYEVRPGIIETDMTSAVKDKYDKLIAGGVTPIKRWGKPEDVGRAVAVIARGDLPFSTGEVINVDGGFHMKTL